MLGLESIGSSALRCCWMSNALYKNLHIIIIIINGFDTCLSEIGIHKREVYCKQVMFMNIEHVLNLIKNGVQYTLHTEMNAIWST